MTAAIQYPDVAIRPEAGEVLLEVDLTAMGASGLEQLSGLFDSFGQPQPLADLVGTDSDSLGDEAAPDPTNQAIPVPVLLDTRREGRPWLLQCGRQLALTLTSLRALREVSGLSGIRLDVRLPAAPQRVSRRNWN